MECPIIPLGDKIVILPQEEGEQMYGNIIVPDAGKEKPEIGTVLAVGPGRISTDGTLEGAIKKVSKLSLVTEETDYTLTGFIESYNNIKSQLVKPFKNI